MRNARRFIKIIVALSAILFVATACGSKTDALPEAQKLKVVATAYPLFEAAANIGGGRVHAIDLLAENPFASLTSAQTAQLQDADLVITLGRGVQPAVDAALVGRTKPTIEILQSFPPSKLPGSDSIDPYVWLNPKNMIVIERQVRDELNTLDAAGQAMYDKYANNLVDDLGRVDAGLVKSLATCKRDTVVATDNRFQYLTDHYGLKYVPVVTQPGVEYIQDPLKVAIDQAKPTTVFEPTFPSQDSAKQTLDLYGVRVAVLDPLIGRTDQARRGGANYGSVMNLNLDALLAALDCDTTVPPGH